MSALEPTHKKKANLLVLGASGGVANCFLHYLVHHRDFFDHVVLLDKRKNILTDPYIDHDRLAYTFLQKKLDLRENADEYLQILKDHAIDIVLDITDYESVPLLEATNIVGVSYINTAMNDDKRTVSELVFDIYARKHTLDKAPHILCTGMNPGVVNMLVRCGIEKYGRPLEIVHFEYDTSKVAKQWHPMMTWSVHEFLVEAVRDPSGIVLGRDKVKILYPNALENRKNMRSILQPIMKLDKYPFGFEVLHEENLTIAQKYDIPSKFIYAVNMKTMNNLIRLYEKNKNVTKKQLMLGDNTTEILDGADSIGVMLEYPERRVYYFNTVPNVAIIGTNATYSQVVIGIFAALFTLLFDPPERGAHFVEDLYDSEFRYHLFDNMRIQEFMFGKTKSGLRLKYYNPEIKIKRRDQHNHLFI
jgi:homospermidine synthase